VDLRPRNLATGDTGHSYKSDNGNGNFDVFSGAPEGELTKTRIALFYLLCEVIMITCFKPNKFHKRRLESGLTSKQNLLPFEIIKYKTSAKKQGFPLLPVLKANQNVFLPSY
jgi:hypothetical protein